MPRSEHPRPDFVRRDWQTLNGTWEFEFDDRDEGMRARWFAADAARFSRTIVVPFAFQSSLSGIRDTAFHDVVWYRRRFTVPAAWRDRRVLLNFGAVDYEAIVWVNGTEVGRHRGGHVGFGFDVTDALRSGENVVSLRVVDPGTDRTVPRGKQYWRPSSESIFYTRTTGLWQPAWIEAAGAVRMANLRVTPDVDRAQVRVEADLVRARRTTPAPATALRVRMTAAIEGVEQADQTTTVYGDRIAATLSLPAQRLWSPDRPVLYDLAVELSGPDGVVDRVESYFGQRKVSLHDGRVYLNNAPYYLRLVLDQGYWPDGILTPPSDDAMQYDIRMTKAFGFNGARKHQKAEDPRWLYYADRMGLLVWGEMANAQDFSPEYASRFADEWAQVIARDYNHPAIVAWVPINESWGVPQILTSAEQQAHAKTLYQMTRSLDATRPVVDNDGWEHTDQTDLMTLHDYARTGEELAAKYAHLTAEPARIPRNGREASVYGARYNGAPFVMSEFGGIAFRLGPQQRSNEWGYAGVEPTRETFLARLDGLVKALRGNRAWAGFCYTQLTDVEQEINGLMTFDRTPKADPDVLKKIIAQ
ncbi:MAG: glycoside hydrolase family 2 [Acidobacteria bacterium]|nr:glycoside hydrolase family 2 [Acidobacteriota bacterium]